MTEFKKIKVMKNIVKNIDKLLKSDEIDKRFKKDLQKKKDILENNKSVKK